MVVTTSSADASTPDAPDLFQSESEALERARAIRADANADAQRYRHALGELIGHYERLMRETRRLIGRSDRAEREMHALTQQLQYRATHDALTDVFNRSAVILGRGSFGCGTRRRVVEQGKDGHLVCHPYE